MKGIVVINGMHLLAPSVDAAAKLATLLGKCHSMIHKWSPKAHEEEYTPAESGDYEARFSVQMRVIQDSQVVKRIPSSRRICAATPPAAATKDGPPQEENP